MKLRNKKTGEIKDLQEVIHQAYQEHNFNSLAELNEEWEDAPEEPEEDYIRVIESFIDYVEEADESFYCDKSVKKFIDRLKAWKRLKDKGFEFEFPVGVGQLDTAEGKFLITITASMPEEYLTDGSVNKDLELLFSGGEE